MPKKRYLLPFLLLAAAQAHAQQAGGSAGAARTEPADPVAARAGGEPAAAVGGPAAAAGEPAGAAGGPAGARNGEDAAAPPPGEPGVKTLSGMSILGNEEAPKSLVIVPWKSSRIGDEVGVANAMDERARPVDKEVFMREVHYYELRSMDTGDAR